MILIVSPPDSQSGQGRGRPIRYFHTLAGHRDELIDFIEDLSLDVDDLNAEHETFLIVRAKGEDFERIVRAGATPIERMQLAEVIAGKKLEEV